MESEHSGVPIETGDTRESREMDEWPGFAASRWVVVTLGVITFILGLILTFRPTHSLIAIAVLIGVVMMVSGVYHVVRAIAGREHHRVWRGLAGVVFFMVGLALIRHINLSVALIGLFVGIAWIIQGVSALVESFSPDRERGVSGWTVFFGFISLIAGIVVVSAPIASVTTLTVFMGIWFMIMGITEIIGSFITRRAMRAQRTEGVSVPSPRRDAAEAGAERGVPSQAAAHDDVADQGATGGTGPANRNFPR
jgi:uncharacterized membrane protein HdeD (DUF308 family)